MTTYTSHLNLKLPDYSDTADIKDLNDNFKKIDDAIASGGTGGGTGGGSGSGSGSFYYKVGEGLKIVGGDTLAVDTATSVEQDNTKPVTSGAVYTEVGNINALLETI